MSRFKLLFLLLALCACTPRKPAPIAPLPPEEAQKPPTASTFEFIVLQMNDVYEISPLGNGRGGMARVATLRKQLLAMNPNVITVLSGDYVSPSLIGSLKCDFGGTTQTVAGRHMVEVMNAVGVDYVTFGNHEFDIKEAEHVARDAESRFRIVSANVLHKMSGGDKPFQQLGADIPSHVVHSFQMPAGGTFRLGLTGVTIDANQAKYVSYSDPYQAALNSAGILRSQADVSFAITHLTMDMDDTLAQRVPGFPLIFGGHEHVNMQRQVGRTTIYKADANAKTVWIHWCRYDPKTQQLHTEHLLFPITDALDEDADVAAVVQKWETFADNCMVSQGYAPDDTIGFYLAPLDGREDAVRFGQTNLGTLITDAMRTVDPSVQCAVLNSGSIRLDDVLQGFIHQRDILATLPFGGGIQKGNVKGSDLRRLLTTGLSQSIKGNGAYLQISGIEIQGSQFSIGGQPLDDAKTYVLTMPSFMAGGGENALAFAKDFCTYTNPEFPQGLKNDLRDIVIWYMKRNGNMDLVRQLLEQQR